MKEFQKRSLLAAALLILGAASGVAEDKSSSVEIGSIETGKKVTTPAVPEEESEPLVDEAAAEAAEEAIDEQKTESEGERHQVYGWKEWIQVGTKSDKMRAKLDSGARTSSLHAEAVEEFERDGRPWVKFILSDPRDEDSKQVTIKAPVKRRAKVKNTDATVEVRHVVELGFEIGDRQMREEFTLNDRSTMVCPILIGRNALRHLGYLDCNRVDLADKKIVK